jgi:phosphate transport system substrate-binding protein
LKRRTVLGAAALVLLPATRAAAQEVLGDTSTVRGTGSTFAYPILSRWAQGYRRWIAGGGEFAAPNTGLDDPPTQPALAYEPSGSLAGVMRVKDAAVDFGASDVPLKSEDLAKVGLAQFPVVIGGIVAVVNIDGVGPGQIKFNGAVLADIYLGKIEKWSHPGIAAFNPGLKLPDAKIVVVRRAEGSGTTAVFTDYLSRSSPEWKAKVGSDFVVPWPTGASARGNQGMARGVAQTKNSIGYVEYAQALQSKLAFALLQNKAGAFVAPEPKSFAAAAASAAWSGASDFNLLLTDAPGEGAYPIVASVYVLMRKGGSPARTRATLAFFQWALEKGAKDAASLGYVPLPDPLVQQVKAYWTTALARGR